MLIVKIIIIVNSYFPMATVWSLFIVYNKEVLNFKIEVYKSTCMFIIIIINKVTIIIKLLQLLIDCNVLILLL